MKQLIAKVAILSMLFFMSVPSLYAQSDAKGKDVPAKSSTEMKDVSLQQPKGKPITAAERQQEQQADEADNEDVSASAVFRFFPTGKSRSGKATERGGV